MHNVEKKTQKGDPLIFPVSSQVETSRDTGPSRRHIQGSKIAKGLPSVTLQYSKIEKPKKWTEWRAPGALKGGTLPKMSTLLSQLKGEKTNFRNLNAEKLKAGPFAIFKHPFCCKISKKLKGGPFGEKKF